MRVRIDGKPDNKKITKTLIREAAHFYTNLLMNKRSSRGLFLTVRFDALDSFTTAEIYRGRCLDPTRPKVFEVVIDERLGFKPTLRALAHELVHMDQMVKGRLYPYSKDAALMRWHKTTYDQEKSEYFFLPWEIEAYGKEIGLYNIFADYLKEKKKK